MSLHVFLIHFDFVLDFSVSSFTTPTPPPVIPLSEVLPKLSTTERGFFEKLDRELDKIESFYRSRESEAIVRYDDRRPDLVPPA